MVLPPLAEFILYIPASSIASDPGRWLEDCLIHGSDYLVLVDNQNLPIRALTLRGLLNILDVSSAPPIVSQHPKNIREPRRPLKEADLSQSSVEIGVVYVTSSVAAAARMVAAAPHLCWVVLNSRQQYRGLLDKTRLLASAFADSIDDSKQELDDAIASEIKVSQSNTALLTYLGHELKTPLTSLLGLSSLLKIGGLGELSPRQNRYIGLIQQHCRRLANWVNVLIDLGRIESGTLKLVPQMVNLAEIWQDAHRQAVLRIGHEEALAHPLPPEFQESANSVTLVADPNRLQQMLSCLMQTALVTQSDLANPQLPLELNLWDDWLTFAVKGLAEFLSLEKLSQTAFALPFPTTPIPSTPISAEMGHWLEWLLVRKLAQYHRGELVLTVNQDIEICPTLLLPKTPAPASARNSRFLLLVAPLNFDSLQTLWRQSHQLKYRLLITQHIKDALEIQSYLPLSAILVLIQSGSDDAIEELQTLKSATQGSESLLVALVPPSQSALLGELPVDRELLWPTDRLGTVLLQPPQVVPSPNRLTILYLRSAEPEQDGNQKFPNIFHEFGCRVLEVDDIEQASLLKRVWKPDVAVLDPAIADPKAYLESLSGSPELSSLPLVTLTMKATQMAHSIPTLTVFPCLVEETSWETPEATERLTTWLIQVLQVAATPPPPLSS